MGIAILPGEAEPPLVVDSDAPLAGAIPAQLLEAIAGGHAQVVGPSGSIQHPQLAETRALHLRTPSFDGLSGE